MKKRINKKFKRHTLSLKFFKSIKMKKLILASNSPRRRDLLIQEGFDFEVIPSSYEENIVLDDPVRTAESFAREKAKDVFKGRVDDIIDLPEKKYLINEIAFSNIDSYKQIM